MFRCWPVNPNNKNRILIYVIEVMDNKTAQSLPLAHETISAYVSQHFNPRRLPVILNHLLTHPNPSPSYQTSTQGQQNSKVRSQARSILNNSNLSLLLANMRVYDDHTIARENSIIESVHRWSVKFAQPKDSIGGQVQVPPMHVVRLKTEVRCQGGSKPIKTGRCKSNKNETLPNLFQFMEHCYKAFLIYEYRLKDLTAIINILSKNMLNCPQSQHFDAMKQALQQLSSKLLGKIQQTKNTVEKCSKIYLQNAQNMAQAQLQQICFPSQIKEDLPKLLFRIASYAKQYQIKMKQINIKYTLLSRQIMSRQARRKSKKKQEEENIPQSEERSGNQIKQEEKLSSCRNSKNAFLSSQFSLKNPFSNRSILKNRLGYLNKQKRISIEIITSLIESERGRKLKLFHDEKESRFKHRLALNIGSFQNLHNQSIKGTRKAKKQVKIDHVQVLKQQNEDENFDKISKGSDQSKTMTQRFKSKRQINLLKYEQLCQKVLKQDDESIFSISQQKQYESLCGSAFSNISRYTITSQASRKSKGKQMKKTAKISSKKNIKSYSSCKDLKKRKSKKNMRQRTMNESLKNIFSEARERKREDKPARAARSGKIVPQNFDRPNYTSFDEVKENIEVEVKKNHKLRMNAHHKLNKNKYRLILQNFNKSKDSSCEENLQKSFKNMERRASRRMGADSLREFEKLALQKRASEAKYNDKHISLTPSASSSRRYQLSNTRINNIEAGREQKEMSVKKVKTEENVEKTMEIPAECKVNFTDRWNIVEDFVKFYPNVECTLHQIAKKRDRQEFLSNAHLGPQNRLFQFVPMSNYLIKKHVQQQGFEGQVKEQQLQKKMFQEENLKLNFSKKLVAVANELQQVELPQYQNEFDCCF